jgi:hypothetical protein
MGTLAGSIARLLHWWWHGDRIRAAPREGRLLRLTPPCFVRIAGQWAEVVSRRVLRDSNVPLIVYRCAGPADAFELAIRPTVDGVRIDLRRGGKTRPLSEDDVEVIRGAACSRPFSS